MHVDGGKHCDLNSELFGCVLINIIFIAHSSSACVRRQEEEDAVDVAESVQLTRIIMHRGRARLQRRLRGSARRLVPGHLVPADLVPAVSEL